jgi:hypothetical protein
LFSFFRSARGSFAGAVFITGNDIFANIIAGLANNGLEATHVAVIENLLGPYSDNVEALSSNYITEVKTR